MFLEVIVFSFLVALLRGGRLKQDLGLKWMWLAPFAFVIQLVNRMMPPVFHLPINALSYACLLYFSWLNLRNQGIRFILIGMLLNGLVILANGGRIPVDLEAAQKIGVDVGDFQSQIMAKHEPLRPGSYLAFLGDVIPVKYPIARMISLGDIFAVCGAFLLVQDVMGKPIRVWRSEEST